VQSVINIADENMITILASVPSMYTLATVNDMYCMEWLRATSSRIKPDDQLGLLLQIASAIQVSDIDIKDRCVKLISAKPLTGTDISITNQKLCLHEMRKSYITSKSCTISIVHLLMLLKAGLPNQKEDIQSILSYAVSVVNSAVSSELTHRACIALLDGAYIINDKADIITLAPQNLTSLPMTQMLEFVLSTFDEFINVRNALILKMGTN
jgi:hypothetical protein